MIHFFKAALGIIIFILGFYMLNTKNFELNFITFALLGILMILTASTEFQKDQKSVFGYFFTGGAVLILYFSLINVYPL
ncbi:hypothetical protein QUF56_13785 [Ureibacillus composti]|nr:hypothetical protein [Ureibacillus composti]